MQEQTTMPDQNSIYSFLKENGLTSKSEADFNKEYADSVKAKELYGFFTENQLTSKDFDVFYEDNFKPIEQKNNSDAVAGLHSSLPYVFVDETNQDNNQIIQSLPGTKENVSYDKNSLPEIGQEKIIDRVIPQQKAPEEQYFESTIKNADISALPVDQKSDKETEGFWSTWLGDAMQGFGGTTMDIVGNIAALNNLPMRSYLNYKVKAEGIPDEERKIFVDSFLQNNPSTAGAEVVKISAKQEAERLSKASDRYDGQDFAKKWEQGDYGAVAGDIFLQGVKSLPYMIMAMGGGWGGLGMIGATSAAGKYENLDNPELPAIYTDKEKADFISQLNMGEFQKLTNSALSGVSEAGSELLGSIPMGQYIGRLVAKVGKPAAKEIVQKGISGWVNKMFDRYGLLIGPIGEGLEEVANSLTTDIIDRATGATTELSAGEMAERAAKSFVYGMGGGSFGSIGAGGVIAYDRLSRNSGSQQQSQPASADNGPQLTVNPRDTYAAEIRQTIEPFAHQGTGNLTVVSGLTQWGEPNKLWFVKYGSQNDIDGSILVEDEQGNQRFLTKDQITGSPIEISVDEFINQKLAKFDQEKALNTAGSQGKMIFNNRLLRRSDNPQEHRTDDSEFWFDDKTEQEVEVPLREVDAWEKRKQVNPTATPEIVTRVYGKTQVSGTRDQSGNILLSEPATVDQADNLRKEVERATGGKSTVQAELIPNEDSTLPDSYQLSIVPAKNNVDTSTEKQTENNQSVTTPSSQDNNVSTEQPKVTYTYKGQEISQQDAKDLVELAILKGNKEKLAGLSYSNDAELDATIEKAWPKPKAKFMLGKKSITPQQALTHIKFSDTLDELNELNAENIDSEPAIAEAYLAKVKQFTPTQIEVSVNNPEQQNENVSKNKTQITDNQNFENIQSVENLQNNQLQNEEFKKGSPTIERQSDNKPIYKLNGKDIDWKTAKARITASILKESVDKLAGLYISNDEQLLSRIKQAFPNFDLNLITGDSVNKREISTDADSRIEEVPTNKQRTNGHPTFQEITDKISELQNFAPNAAPIEVLATKEELPESIKNHKSFGENISGVWYNGKIYVIADKVHSIDEIVKIWIHENGIHNGLRNIIPTGYFKQFLEKVHDSFIAEGKNSPEFQQISERVNKDYSGFSKAARAEEFLAFLSEKIINEEDLLPMEQSLWRKYIDIFRDFLRRLFNFNSDLLTAKQIVEITRFAVQSNFQKNEYADSTPGGSTEIRRRTPDNASTGEGRTGDAGRFQDESGTGLSDEIRPGRIFSGNRENTQSEIKLRKLSQQAKDNPSNFFEYLKSSSDEVRHKKRLPQKVRTRVDRFTSRFIDGNKAVLILLEEFNLKVPDYANVFLALNQKSSRQMGNKNEFEKKFYNPLLRSIGKVVSELEKTGLNREESYSQVTDYLIARHAPERNKWFRSLGKKGENFSGMTDAQAKVIYEKMESIIPQEMIDDLWNNIRKCTQRISKYWVDYGKYSQSSLEEIMNRNWEYYVPLRGFEPIAEEIELDYEQSEKRSDFAGNEKTEGRESRSDDPIVYIFQMGNSSIIWGEKNRSKRSAYNLIKLNSNRKELFELAKITYMTDKLGATTEVVLDPNGTYNDKNGKEQPEFKVSLLNVDDDGNVKKTELGNKSRLVEDGNKFSVSNTDPFSHSKPKYLRKQHEVDVYVDGSKFKMIFKDPAISNAINGDNYSQAINFKYLPIANITRFLSRGVTSWSPAFITKNTYRDFRTGSITMFIQRGFKDSLKFSAKYKDAARFLASNLLNDAIKDSRNPDDRFLNLLGAEPKTDVEKKWKVWYDEFNLNGGPTGHSYLMPLDEVRTKVEQYINKIKRSKSIELLSLANPLNALKALENLSGYGENIARFTAYVMARERGESIIKSINEAKEITTNFDTRGEYSATIGSFILFFNASVQGAAKQYNLAKNHPFRYFVVKAVSLVIQGLLCRWLWDLMNPDDEDKDYAEINKYTMFNSTVIGWKDNYVTIPLPQGYRVWNALGTAIYEHQTGKLSTEQMAFDMAEMFSTAMSPVDLVGVFDRKNKLSYPKVVGNLISPIRPIMDLSINEKFNNGLIYREPFLSNRESRFSDSQMYLNQTNALLISFTDWMYKQGGGDIELGTKTVNGKRIPGVLDWNPAKIEYILKSYTGGPGQTILDALNYLTLKTIDDVDKRIIDTEHKIEGFDPTSIPILQSYYHKRYVGLMYDEYRDLANEAEMLKTENKRRENTNDPDKMFGMPDEKVEFITDYDITNSLINELLDLKKEVQNEDELKSIDLQILNIRREFVSKYKYFGK